LNKKMNLSIIVSKRLIFLLTIFPLSSLLLGISMGSGLLNEFELTDKAIEQNLLITNEADKACFVRVYSEDDISSGWYPTLPDTVMISPKTNYIYTLNTKIPEELIDQSYHTKIYVEEIGAVQAQKTSFGSIGTSVRYEINNIYHHNYSPTLNIELNNFKISDNAISFDLTNQDDYFLKAEISVQIINNSGEISKEIKDKYKILNKKTRKCNLKLGNDLATNSIKQVLIVITNQEDEICVFEKKI